MEIEEDERRGREETRLKGKLLLRASTSWPTEEAISRQIDSRLRLRHTDRNSAVILSHLSFPFFLSLLTLTFRRASSSAVRLLGFVLYVSLLANRNREYVIFD